MQRDRGLASLIPLAFHGIIYDGMHMGTGVIKALACTSTGTVWHNLNRPALYVTPISNASRAKGDVWIVSNPDANHSVLGTSTSYGGYVYIT